MMNLKSNEQDIDAHERIIIILNFFSYGLIIEFNVEHFEISNHPSKLRSIININILFTLKFNKFQKSIDKKYREFKAISAIEYWNGDWILYRSIQDPKMLVVCNKYVGNEESSKIYRRFQRPQKYIDPNWPTIFTLAHPLPVSKSLPGEQERQLGWPGQ